MKKLVSQLAVAVAGGLVAVTLMGGGPVGAFSVPNNSVNSAKIVNNSVQGVDIRQNTVTSADIRNGTIGVGDMNNAAKSRLVNLYAFVDADSGGATLLSGRGVTGVSRIGVGVYSVTFNRSVQGCGKLATLTDEGGGIAAEGEIAVEGFQLNGIWVRTFDSAGAPEDRAATDGFTLMVLC